MPALMAALRVLVTQIGALMAALGINNAVGWLVGTAVTVSFIALWIGVLNFAFSYITTALIGTTGIFNGFPAAGMWLINQAMPVQLFFTLTVTYILFRLSAGKMLVIAIAATRYLKGK
jgi:hypothetical protein